MREGRREASKERIGMGIGERLEFVKKLGKRNGKKLGLEAGIEKNWRKKGSQNKNLDSVP